MTKGTLALIIFLALSAQVSVAALVGFNRRKRQFEVHKPRSSDSGRPPARTDMQESLIRHEVVPFLLLFGALIVLTTIGDALLHYLDLIWVGRYLGIPGTLMILLSFVYSLRKHGLISKGHPRTLLRLHQILACTGALMIFVHAGIHVYAILPWLALIAMSINVISGITGQFLLGRSRRYLAREKAEYAEYGSPDPAMEKQLFWDATAFELMQKWRAVHLPITLAFAGLSLAHIISIFVFWQWR